MSVAGIPPSILQEYPAMTPPAGTKSNFNDSPSRKDLLIILNSIFLSLMAIAVTVRLFVKAKILRTIGWDDYTCAFAALCSTIHTAVMIDITSIGYGRHLWDIRAITLLDHRNVQRLNSISIVYPFCIYFVKISILLQYIRIFGVARQVRIAAWFGIGLFTIFYLAYAGVQIASLVMCLSTDSVKNGLCRDVYALTIFQGVFNVISDFYVFLIPIRSIIKLQVTKRQRVGLLFIFLAGLVACVVSVVRLIVTALTLNLSDKLWNASLCSTFTIIEINLAIIAACMSTVPGFLAKTKLYGSTIYKSLRTKIFSSRTTTSKTDGQTEGKDSLSPKHHDNNYVELMENSHFGAQNQSSDQVPLRA